MKMLASRMSFAIGLLLAPQVPAQPELPESLQQAYGQFAAAMVNGQAKDALEFYAEDAVVLVDHEHVYRGRSEILGGFLNVYLAPPAGEDDPGTEIEEDGVIVGEGAVTLAGRYSSRTGTSAIYSNTWQRQNDETWKLAVSVMTFESTGSEMTSAERKFSCTQVLGYSQSIQWFAGLSLAEHVEEGQPPDLPPLKRGAFLPGWQGRFFLGGAIEHWADPEYPGWSGPHVRAYETPAHCPPEEVDRVVFNVSGKARSVEEWAAAIESVAEVIRLKFPDDPQIVMQPAVGAPESMCKEVRAARNQPVISEGIRLAAESGKVQAGPEPKVTSCSQFHDELGHLTREGARHVHRFLREQYGASTATAAPGRSAAGSPQELLRRPYTTAENGEKREYFVFLPRGYYDVPRVDWPVIFFLHGSGERGDGRDDLDWVLAHGPLYEAWVQKRDLPFIIVSPQLPVFDQAWQIEARQDREPPRRLEDGTPPRYEICPLDGNEAECRVADHRRDFNRRRENARPIARLDAEDHPRVKPFDMEFEYPPEGWPPAGWFRIEEDLVAILDHVLEDFRADPDRVYLSGISYGGFGAFDLAASHPDRWAALAPVVGTGDLADASTLAESGIPIWMFSGGTDTLVKPHWLYAMARALEEAGHPNVRLTVHEDMTHDVGRRVFSGRDLYDWFLSHRRR